MIKNVIRAINLNFLIVFSIILFAIPVLASEKTMNKGTGPIITPQYTYINSASSSLSITGGIASVKGVVQKNPSGKTISMTCILQKKSGSSWSDIKSWTDSTSTSSVQISEKYSVLKGEYRVKANYSVSGTSGTETGTVYSKTVQY